MRESVKLGKLGEVACLPPASFASIVDLIDEFRPDTPRRKRLRACAAAIGICTRVETLPKYRAERSDIMEYGTRVMDSLMRDGVTLATIADVGSVLISDCIESLPSEDEVTEAEDFSEAAKAAS
tara:strand:+ start:2726 stop:3097 length:372 start_codon:yes stop_codon:yes gene_type:complete